MKGKPKLLERKGNDEESDLPLASARAFLGSLRQEGVLWCWDSLVRGEVLVERS